MAGGKLSFATIDSRHEELLAGLPKAPKPAALKLIAHLADLPDLVTYPPALYYQVDTLHRLVDLVLDPFPLTSNLPLLTDLLSLLAGLPEPIAARLPRLPEARARLGALRCLELAAQDDWEAAKHALPAGADVGTAESQDMDLLLGSLGVLLRGGGAVWPFHVRPIRTLSPGTVLTVLVDGEGVPPECREAYLATVNASVHLKRCSQPGPPVVRSVSDRGEELVVGEDLRDLVIEALDRTTALLGPQVHAKLRTSQTEVILAIRHPAPVTEVTGRSILLPLIIALAQALGERLNLSAVVRADSGVVWTGDVDSYGSLEAVSHIEEKIHRVAYSRCKGFAFPAQQLEEVNDAIGSGKAGRVLDAIPVTNLVDLLGRVSAVSIQSRGTAVRAGVAIKRRARPLGIAGVAAAGLLIVALGIGLPRIASWLDTTVASAAFTETRDKIQVFNASGRGLRSFPIVPTEGFRVLAIDVDLDGRREIFYGTGVRDSVPGTLFCLDDHGRERWRFRGGFREGEPKPYDLRNTFSAGGPYVHDLDHDGLNEVVAVFNHSPYSPGQLALLTREGEYLSSFWHPGALYGAPLSNDMHAAAFVDIDQDGLDEILIGATNNRLNMPVLAILDPRSIRGKGPMSLDDTTGARWQSYVVFPACPPFEETASTVARLAVMEVKAIRWEGQDALRVSSSGYAPDGTLCGFAYHLDSDLNLLWYNANDQILKWIRRARRRGETDADVDSPEFRRMMTDIRIIPGDPRLLLPPEDGFRLIPPESPTAPGTGRERS